MTAAEFALLAGFAVVKMTLGLALVYFGLRGSGRDDPEASFGDPEPDLPPVRPTVRPLPRNRRRAARGGPRARVPRRMAGV